MLDVSERAGTEGKHPVCVYNESAAAAEDQLLALYS